jgi:hypothetical protein
VDQAAVPALDVVGALASTAAVITLVALAAAASLNAMADDPALAPGIEQMHGAEVISSGFHFGMLTIAVLGALLITGEYATGLIRSTFAAVPTRIPVLAAKALTLVVLTAAVTLVSVTLSYFLTMPRLSQYDLVPALDGPGTWRVFGGTLYSLIAAALFSLGIGTLLRSTAASLTAAPNDQRRRRRTGGVPKRPGAGPLPVMETPYPSTAPGRSSPRCATCDSPNPAYASRSASIPADGSSATSRSASMAMISDSEMSRAATVPRAVSSHCVAWGDPHSSRQRARCAEVQSRPEGIGGTGRAQPSAGRSMRACRLPIAPRWTRL